MAGIRLDSHESERPFKGIFCDDVSEFESHMASHAVGSPCAGSDILKGENPADLPVQAPLASSGRQMFASIQSVSGDAAGIGNILSPLLTEQLRSVVQALGQLSPDNSSHSRFDGELSNIFTLA